MLNFSTSIEDLIASQYRQREQAFITFASKKQILSSEEVSEKIKGIIKDLKGTFAFNLHTSYLYLIITLFDRKTKKYRYLILDTNSLKYSELGSIKEAKQEVANLVASNHKKEAKESKTAEVQEVPKENKTAITPKRIAKNPSKKTAVK